MRPTNRTIQPRFTVAALAVFAGLTLAATAHSAEAETVAIASKMKNSSVAALAEDSRMFAKNPAVQARMARFANRYGIEVAGHLYLPRDFDPKKRYAALALSGPFGAVKEQVSGLYAQEMAGRGFVALAFDPSFTGESGGAVRNPGSPEINTEDFSAAVDFLSLLDFVDPKRVGVIGICGLSGPAITAATNDTRIRAVATSAMYDMSSSIRDHYQGDWYTPEQRELVKGYLAEMRLKEAERGESIPGLHEVPLGADGKPVYAAALFPDKLPENADSVTREFFGYYRERALHPRSINSAAAWSSTTPYGFFGFPLTAHVEELSPRPLLLITGDKAHSKYHSDAVFERAKEPRELLAVPGATHTDLYDNMEKIPFDRLERFFAEALGQ